MWWKTLATRARVLFFLPSGSRLVCEISWHSPIKTRQNPTQSISRYTPLIWWQRTSI
jgi:hypothetical protein